MAQLEEYAANLKSEKERVEEELENATMKICGFESQMKLVSFFYKHMWPWDCYGRHWKTWMHPVLYEVATNI